MPWGLLLAAIAAAILLHALALGLLRWPSPTPEPAATIVTVELQPAAPLPLEQRVGPVEPDRPAALSVDAGAPASVTLPLPDIPTGPVREGVDGSGRGGPGRAPAPGEDPLVDVGALQIPARRVVFMVDVSSSMRGSIAEDTTIADVASRTVCRALGGLPESVRFRLMCFSGTLAEPLGPAWRWKADADVACRALDQAASNASGLTRSTSLFDAGGLGEAEADAVVLVTDGGILDLEAGALERWLDEAPLVRLDVVMIGPVATPTEAQRSLGRLARRTGGGLHRLFGAWQ